MAERLLPSNYSSVPSSGIIVKLFPVAISVFLDGSQRYSLMGKSALRLYVDDIRVFTFKRLTNKAQHVISLPNHCVCVDVEFQF